MSEVAEVESTELVTLPPKESALQAYGTEGGMTKECAKLAVTLIAKGEIPAIKINY